MHEKIQPPPPASRSPERMSEKDLRALLAEVQDRSNSIENCDLHGLAPEDAARETERFIYAQLAADKPCCRIMHGKGKGVLEGVVRQKITELTGNNLVESFFSSERYPGAAIVVVFPPDEEKP